MMLPGNHGDHSEQWACDAELEDADIDDVEVGQSTSRRLDSFQWKYPRDGADVAEVFLLLVQIRRDVMTHEREKACNDICFVAVACELEKDGFLVKKEAEEGDDGIDRYHGEDANDAVELTHALLPEVRDILLLLV